MDKSTPQQPADRATRFARLFDREKFRRRTLKVYRVAGPIVLAYFTLSLLQWAGLLGGLSADTAPHWLLVIYALLTYGVALATPVLFALASIGGLALKSDWRFATPLWLFAFASGLFLVTIFMAGALAQADQAQVWTVARTLLVISAAWASIVGYRRSE